MTQGTFRIPPDQPFETRTGEAGFSVEFESEAQFLKMLRTGAVVPAQPLSAQYSFSAGPGGSGTSGRRIRQFGGVSIGGKRGEIVACCARSVDQIAEFVLGFISSLDSVSQVDHRQDLAVRFRIHSPTPAYWLSVRPPLLHPLRLVLHDVICRWMLWTLINATPFSMNGAVPSKSALNPAPLFPNVVPSGALHQFKPNA